MKLGELSPQNITLSRSEIETEIQAITALMSQVKMRPHFTGGKPGSLSFSRVKPGSVYSKLGLQSGDTILSINGSPIRADEALRFYESLNSSPKVEIQIRRGDQLQNIYYNITE
jgi:general secretion pathway protein C